MIKEGYRIKDIEASQRPRERLEKQGAQALNDAELIAILLRTGIRGSSAIEIAQHLLFEFKGLSGLQQASFAQICKIEGVGKAKAAQIKAAIELGLRLSVLTPEEKPLISTPQDVANQVQYKMAGLEQEELWVLLLDTRNRHMFTSQLYRGSLNSSSVRPAEIFKEAIRLNAASVIIVHNHPSGDPAPSPEDVNLTRMLIEAGELLEVPVLDHVIVGSRGIASIKALHPNLW